MMTFLLWCFLLIVCWPVAILVLILYPFIWLILLPFRLIGVAVSGAFELIHGLITLPVKVFQRI